ncbi:amidohydrolase family protein [Actinomadura sp. LD22]|uniref:Amidohydrolase family protein n=1 Tax=Actinomadura physcomitrii TaxID=2650748 RepID=A0A6I4MGY5_9ACTN|nr:amidohydrolase family protein [Actinomadura physcomitrii]MWA05428.1 amidohydrolase family protein [Actinomadura physcomitrii]
MRIDVHAHYWPAAYIDLLVELGREDLKFAGRQRDDLDERVALLDETGVDLQILSAIGLNTEVEGAEASARAAACINDIYHQAKQKHPGRLQAFGSVPLPHVDAAIAETERCLGELGFTGIALPCSFSGKPIDHPDFEPFWANLARHDAVVYVHPAGTDSSPHPGLADWGLHTAFGSPTQIAVAPVRIMYSGVSTRHPSLRFVFAMCAGNLPFLWPRLERNLRRGLEQSAVKAVGSGYFTWMNDLPLEPGDPMAGLRRFWYDVAIQDVPLALAAAKETYGADRLLLGSDEIFASLPEAIAYVQDSPYLTAEEKTAVLDRNAAQMLGLTDTTPTT